MAQTILSNASAGIQEVRVRCKEALDHLSCTESLAAIGALAGVEVRVRYAITILQVLQQWRTAQAKTKEEK